MRFQRYVVYRIEHLVNRTGLHLGVGLLNQIIKSGDMKTDYRWQKLHSFPLDSHKST